MRWLKEEALGIQAVFLIFAAVAVNLLYVIVGLNVTASLGIDIPPASGAEDLVDFSSLFLRSGDMLLEEVAFRLPLAILVWAAWPLIGIIAFAGFASVVFGAIHGSLWHVLFQGVGGFMFSLLFLKCGGLQKRWVKALACAFTAHFLYNATILVLVTM